jgi:uncharacterized membrane protein YfcA
MSPILQLDLCALVLALAAVQSVFGVGLLVFGTPALLLMGFPFPAVLAYLLPCSLMISTLQIVHGGLTLEPIRRKLLAFTAPAVICGTFLILVFLRHKVDMRVIVGAMLVITAGLRLLGPARHKMQSFVRAKLSPLLIVLGFLHGVSNLGGGVLTFVVSSVYADKRNVRKHIAFGYGLMALLQLAVLLLTTPVHVNLWLWAALPLLAALSYALVGRWLFAMAGESIYQWSLTAMIGIFGILLLLPA